MTTAPVPVIALILVVAIVVGFRVNRRYQAERRAGAAQLEAGSTIVQTARGPIEYAEIGRGPAALFSHGANGAYDQGLHCVKWLGDAGVRFICPSRFGYLRTPLPSDASPAAQADAHAALLDALGIERACVIGVSAGGMSALRSRCGIPTDAGGW